MQLLQDFINFYNCSNFLWSTLKFWKTPVTRFFSASLKATQIYFDQLVNIQYFRQNMVFSPPSTLFHHIPQTFSLQNCKIEKSFFFRQLLQLIQNAFKFYQTQKTTAPLRNERGNSNRRFTSVFWIVKFFKNVFVCFFNFRAIKRVRKR